MACKDRMYGPLPKRPQYTDAEAIATFFGKGSVISRHIHLIITYQKVPMLIGRYATPRCDESLMTRWKGLHVVNRCTCENCRKILRLLRLQLVYSVVPLLGGPG